MQLDEILSCISGSATSSPGRTSWRTTIISAATAPTSSLRLELAKRLGVVVLWSNEGDKIALLSSSEAKDPAAKVDGCVLELAEIAERSAA